VTVPQPAPAVEAIVGEPMRRIAPLRGAAIGVALLALMPLLPEGIFTPSLRQILITTFLVAFAGFGWNVVSGYLGYLTLGEHLFFGIGAYVTVYAVAKHNVSPLLAIPIAIAVVVLLTGAMTFLVTRLSFRGLYYALVTLAVAEVGRILVIDIGAFGRYAGLYLPPIERPSYLLFLSSTTHYYVNLGLLAAGGLGVWLLDRSRLGLEMRALNNDEVAARTLGIPLRRRLWQASAISGTYFAIAGMVYSFQLLFVRPTTALSISIVVDVLIMVLIGGLGRVWGPFVGMAVIASLRYGITLLHLSTTSSAQIAVIVQASVLIAVIALRGRSGASVVATIRQVFRRGRRPLRVASARVDPSVPTPTTRESTAGQ
jgi:branched-chain amino acid transport system permease protein